MNAKLDLAPDRDEAPALGSRIWHVCCPPERWSDIEVGEAACSEIMLHMNMVQLFSGFSPQSSKSLAVVLIRRGLSRSSAYLTDPLSRGVSAGYLYALLRLPWLAPDIITAIVNGRQPLQLNAMKLMRLTAHLPADWTEQRALLGFR